MIVVTPFGELEVDESSCITLHGGLVGLPQAQKFFLLDNREDSPFLWLQCVDEPTISLAVINPMEFFSDYAFDLQDADVEELGLENAGDAVVLSTITVDRQGRVTTNLLGPVVINGNTKVGKQIVLSNENYSIKHVLFETKVTTEKRTKEVARTRAA